MSDPAPSTRKIVVNLRSQSAALTGVQRYSLELCARMNGRIETLAPRQPLHGLIGHLWEQTMLPISLGRRLLWSPANTGPLTIAHQVLTVHDVASLDHPEWFDSKFGAWYRRMTPALAKRVRRVITVSEFSKQRLMAAAGVDGSRIEVIPNGVDQRFHRLKDGDIHDMRVRLRLPTDKYILSLGSIEPRKNLSRLLTAWSTCLARMPENIWLVIAGSNGEQHVFASTKLAEIPPRVHYTGFVPDQELPALYSGALAFVYPSIYEGFGLPVLEAMATGTPIIAANSTAIPELVGDAGLLVDVSDPREIAMPIMRIIEDENKRAELSARAIGRSLQFTWERAATSTLKVLCEAAAL
jgi:glycosyltransferase involved in cell wall biosynthesis